MDHVSYVLILLSVACIVFLFTNMLVQLYDRLANPQTDSNTNDYTEAHAAEDLELHSLMSDEADDAGEYRWMLPKEGRGQSIDNSGPSVAGKTV